MNLKNILSKLPECNIILYASPGKEGFYVKNNFRKMKTGMVQFVNAEKMTEKGFTKYEKRRWIDQELATSSSEPA
jgi:hypothetical protein